MLPWQLLRTDWFYEIKLFYSLVQNEFFYDFKFTKPGMELFALKVDNDMI